MSRYIFLFILIFFISCNNSKNNEIIQNNNNVEENNSLINEYARFISGIDTKEFEEIQKKNFYKNYADAIETSWNYFYLNQMTLIKTWSAKNNITNENDTTNLFYPFSGPDYPFAEAFFPYAKNYIFIGLENIGRIPDFKNYSDLQIEKYLYEFSNSLTEFFQNGYFSTKNMKNNFKNPDMNGIVHPLIFFITRSGNKITNLNNIVIDKFGQPLVVSNFNPLETRLKGLKITFNSKYGKKNLYYIQVDISNENFLDHPELYTFISNFKEKNVFVKSASYLLQKEDFSLFRDFLFSQSVKILQDDSGFSYKFLKNNNLNIKLFGKYNHTLNIFKEYQQKDLQEAYNNLKLGKLAFRFGYNIPFEETALIFAEKANSNIQDYPYYKIQFQMSWHKQNTDTFDTELQPISYYFDEGYYKYTSGYFKDIEQAKKSLQDIRKKFPDAFIIEINEYSKKVIDE